MYISVDRFFSLDIDLAITTKLKGFLRWLSDKKFACIAGDVGFIPGLGRTLGEGNNGSLHYSCLLVNMP